MRNDKRPYLQLLGFFDKQKRTPFGTTEPFMAIANIIVGTKAI